jgi:hypothetical protein
MNVIDSFRSLFHFICLGTLAVLVLYGCKRRDKALENNFVRMEKGKMLYQGKVWFPVLVNYVVDFVQTPEGPALSPTRNYEDPASYEYLHREGLYNQFDAHFTLLARNGVNSIRLCFDRTSHTDKGVFYSVHQGPPLSAIADTALIYNALTPVIRAAGEHGIRIMLLIRNPASHPELEPFTLGLLKRFAREPIIFSYDFFNEPLYFDSQRLSKNEVYHHVKTWRKWMDEHAPLQLFTIGVAEPIEVSRWDVSVLPIDFVAFHTYHPLRVPNEVYWYSRYAGKPWMIGETNLPANGDSISYDEQRQFMLEALAQSKRCGAVGFGWWEFQDEPPLARDEWAYGGLLNNEGLTTVPGKTHVIQGTPKPAFGHLAKALEKTYTGPCTCAVNYHNMVGYENIVLRGTVVDAKTNRPIEGATIRGWNETWAVGMNTFSDAQGHFTLYSNDECVHFEISAPGTELFKFSQRYVYTPLKPGAPPITELPRRDLEYHSIHYQPFLRNLPIPERIEAEHYVFDFNPELFARAVYQGNMGLVPLQRFKPQKPGK